jgi:hypothetical protein
MLDSGFDLDIGAVNQNIAEAEVVSLYFPLLQKSLLIDTRSSDSIGPMVSVVPMVNGSSERLRSLRRLRPQFPRPESLTLIPWMGRVGSLSATGVWASLLERLDGCGGERCLEEAQRCFARLNSLEREEMRRAITGEEHRTIWDSSGAAG